MICASIAFSRQMLSPKDMQTETEQESKENNPLILALFFVHEFALLNREQAW